MCLRDLWFFVCKYILIMIEGEWGVFKMKIVFGIIVYVLIVVSGG